MAISESDGVITYSEHLAAWARIFIGIIGVAMAVIGPATMIAIAVPLWSISFALTVFTGLVLLLFGLFALAAAVSRTRRLEFRIAERKLVVSTHGPFGGRRAEHDFMAVGGPTFEMRDSEDGAFAVLGIALRGRTFPLEMTGFADAGEARRWQARLTSVLAMPVSPSSIGIQ